ncbi:hypothetical protein [Ectobacillus ponti]|uniref:Uncharacterized protein n=1 Tax=Ectobacillus ponti TaxID=2961894 RepID=A0AA42BSE6_9BACI|nr:hypothetical protein [Ectobacillus ponti]MCP8971306.1 hypothetical protein [Ectobacillus ponti]
MTTVGFCKVYRDKRRNGFCAMGIHSIHANEFQQEGKRKRLQFSHIQAGMRIQAEVLLDTLRDCKQTVRGTTDTDFYFQKNNSGYSLPFFHVPLTKIEGVWQGKLEVSIGTVYIKILRPLPQRPMKPQKDLPAVLHEDLLPKKEQPASKHEPSLHTLRQQKGIHIAWGMYKRCDKCLNLGEGNICLVHKLTVEKNCICKQFYPYTVHLGGGFSPR